MLPGKSAHFGGQHDYAFWMDLPEYKGLEGCARFEPGMVQPHFTETIKIHDAHKSSNVNQHSPDVYSGDYDSDNESADMRSLVRHSIRI